MKLPEDEELNVPKTIAILLVFIGIAELIVNMIDSLQAIN